MKGYKAFDSDLKCRGYQYEVGKTYKHDGDISICNRGFHFCERLVDCFDYYNFSEKPRFCEVEAIGETSTEGNKSVTDEIKIISELTWDDVLLLANIGKDCTGYGNTGHHNTGNRNTGYRNTGHLNTGHCNTGDYNTGHHNTGNRNTGDWNTGNRNTGHYNTGNHNTGNHNTGDRNTGHYNTGYRNTGDYNTGDNSSGVLCSEDAKILIFDEQSSLTLSEWRSSDASRLMSNIEFKTTEWRYEEDMSDEEKATHPEHELMGGYLKKYDKPRYAFAEWWDSLSERDKETIKAIPNFNAEKWESITGIKVDA